MDIGGWLRSLGLEEYEAAFHENEIDETVLPKLTQENLKELGVTALGHRLKLLDAITALRADTLVKPSLNDAVALSTTPNLSPGDRAERRQVTVMFSDLVGSTALSTSMDPEDLREVISAYHKCVAETLRRFDGFVAQYMGDGVLVYFGYPEAHEDDAERAVRAGLELIAAVAELKTHAILQTRVGIATGLVVVGDLMRSGEAQERGIVGETPNLAARLQGIAEPNTVVIAEGTRRLVGNLFELNNLGAQDLKGIARPVRAWAALRPASVESRFEALHASGLTALVGRDEETELLLRRWSRAKSGEGQVVLVSGEAGVGKSRLTAALLESVAPATAHKIALFLLASTHRQRTLSDHRSNGTCSLRCHTTTCRKLSSTSWLRCWRRPRPPSRTRRSSPRCCRCRTMDAILLDPAPQQRRQKTLFALIAQMQALTRQNPVLMIFEDAHWTDPTSLEALGRIVDRIVALRALLIVTFRPEFEAPWIGRPHATTLILNRLTEREVGAMIDRIAGNKLIPASIRQDIIERTDGIPLFVEEMTKAVLEAEGEGAAQYVAAAIPSTALAVPASLHASLMARLDRLGRAKEVAQIGAAIGREFSHALLSSVVRRLHGELGSALDRLIAAGLLFRQGVPPHATYLFKHTLVQEAAYGTLLREPRRALHARIAETLENQFAEIAETQPELLARHYTEAGLIEKAAGLWGKAGQRSLARSALAEAVEQFTRALGQIAALPTTPALRREQIKLQVALANALMPTKGHSAPETKAAVERARLLVEQAVAQGEPPEDPLLLLSVLFSYWLTSYNEVNGDETCELAEQLLALAERQGTTVPLMIGHRVMGISLLSAGHIAEGRAHLDRAITLYDPAEHRSLVTRFSTDSRVVMLGYRSWPLWLLGYPEAALADAEHALKDAREIGQATTLISALLFGSLTLVDYGNYARATPQCDEAAVLANEKGALFWKARGMMTRGCVLALTGKAGDAVEMITTGMTAYRSTGATVFAPLYLLHLARAYTELGQLEDAWRSIGEAMTAVKTTKERWCEAEIDRIAGEIALKSPQRDAAKAQACFERALEVARAQQAKSWELRASMSVARLWRDQGKHHEAHDLLVPVYNWFTEGFDTPDLKETKALLDELA